MTHALVTPKGRPFAMHAREGTSDLSIIHSTTIHDEYGLKSLPDLQGWALDLGAHIGSVAIPLAIDNPGLRVIAVEAVPENVRVLQANVQANDLIGRVEVFGVALTRQDGEATAWSEYTHQDGLDRSYVWTNRYIGNVERPRPGSSWEGRSDTVPAMSLSTILDQVDDVVFAKMDCEGCEWAAFADPAIVKLRLIIGEYHDLSSVHVHAALGATHRVETWPASVEQPDEGIGIFRAERLY